MKWTAGYSEVMFRQDLVAGELEISWGISRISRETPQGKSATS
jgi:hypothetical protein